MFRSAAAAVAAVALAASAPAADAPKAGKVALQSAGPLAFGPNGVLFVGDPQAAAVYAVETGDTTAAPVSPVTVEKLDAKLAGLLGVKSEDVQINDLAVNPASNRVYLSVSRGKTAGAAPVLFKVGPDGSLAEVALDNVTFSKTELSKPVADAKKRQEAITGLKFSKGKLYVAGLSNEEFASTLRSIPYPFDGKAAAAGVQVYHGAHGKYETAAPVRTFTPIEVNGKDELLAAYTCTPLVRVPVNEIQDGAKVKGTTVAELGNRNRPLDIVTFTKGGKSFALLANSARGVQKVGLDGIERVDAIVQKINGTAGLAFDTVADLKGVEQLDKLGDAHAVLLVRGPDGLAVKTIELP
jgi:hypothetical protein